MDWGQLLSKKRLGSSETPVRRTGRSEFESDVDRIIFSPSFRRLGRKTQVHPLAANDHVHTRLTHSLEVARVGFALGKTLGVRLSGNNVKESLRLPDDISVDDLGAIVNAACLAHDLGNPPFGHAGEDAIINWFDNNRQILPNTLSDKYRHDLRSLEGNAQGFRIITQLENHVFGGGVRLTYATLAAFQKYPWTSDLSTKKFGFYLSENEILEDVFHNVGITKKQDGRWPRHPLAYLVEAADDICYCTIDIEDAVEIGIVRFEEAFDAILSAFPEKERDSIKLSVDGENNNHRVLFSRIRGRVFDKLIESSINGFMENYESIMEGNLKHESLFDALGKVDNSGNFIREAKKFGRDLIYNDSKKVEIEIGCYATLDVLLKEFCTAALHQSDMLCQIKNPAEHKIQWKSERVLKLLGDHAPSLENGPPGGWTPYQCVRRAIDFVSGMTDNYAIYISKQLQGGGFSGLQRP